MAKRYWLFKSEPDVFSLEDLRKAKRTAWDGVRNYQARNNLAAMQKGDRVLVYHSVKEQAVVGIAEVVREAYPDPTTGDARWVAVDLAAVKALPRPVPLAEMKADRILRDIPLVRQSRLSVMPLPKAAFDRIVALGT